MQNSYTERTSRADNSASSGSTNNTKHYNVEQTLAEPLTAKRASNRSTSSFAGAAGIILKSGFVVLYVIARAIKATAKSLLVFRRENMKVQDALPKENEL